MRIDFWIAFRAVAKDAMVRGKTEYYLMSNVAFEMECFLPKLGCQPLFGEGTQSCDDASLLVGDVDHMCSKKSNTSRRAQIDRGRTIEKSSADPLLAEVSCCRPL